MTAISSKRGALPKKLRRLLLAGLIVCAVPAYAQEIQVNSAEPSSAEQETFDLEVTVSGDGFGADSVVDFLVTGTTNPGGITIKNVKRQGPKTLKVTVDVAPDATVEDFDVRVMSRGRTGKGTELFRVLQKPNSGDTTPPGVVTDLTWVGGSYNRIGLSWTAPADDGFDSSSGPAWRESFQCRPEGGVEWDFCECYSPWGTNLPGTPNQVTSCEVWRYFAGLTPETNYQFRVKYQDHAGNFSERSAPVWGRTEALVTDPSWTVQEVPVELNASMGHAFTAGGNLIIPGMVTNNIRIAYGTPDSGDWAWTFEDVPGEGNTFALDPSSGKPAFGAMPWGSHPEITYTFHDGTVWTTEVVTELRQAVAEWVDVAFDPLIGQPAIAWCAEGDSDSGGVGLARRQSTGEWLVERVDPSPCSHHNHVTHLAFDPHGNLAIAYGKLIDADSYPDAVEVAIWTVGTGTWTFERMDTPVPDPNTPPVMVGSGLDLFWDPVTSDFVASFEHFDTMKLCQRSAGTWLCERLFPGESELGAVLQLELHGDFLATDPSGQVLLAHATHNDVIFAEGVLGGSWAQEIVDYAWAHPLGDDILLQSGPHLALDPAGSPTLSWAWNIGGDQPLERHLYFAWKSETPGQCPNGICDQGESPCSCPGDCGLPPLVEDPGVTGMCTDAVDNDCDGTIDAEDTSSCCSDADLDGFTADLCGGIDCDDGDAGVNPTAVEHCSDGLDNDCDGDVDCDDSTCCVCAPTYAPCTTDSDCCSGACHEKKGWCHR